jgi:type IV pilus assembly protein PilW
MSGFYGELSVAGVAAPGALPLDQCSVTASDWQAWILLHVQGYDAGSGFNQTLCALQNHKAGTDIILVRRARACTAGISGCDAAVSGKPYLQVSLCATEVTTYKLGVQGTETFDLKQKDCANVAGRRQYYVHIYYISTDNGAGTTVPTLKRIELDGTAWSTTALVEGIEELNISYGVDSNSDGAPDSYVAAPNSVATWSNVVSVQLHLLARNLEVSPDYTDTKTYALGIDSAGTAVTVTPGGNYRRHVYSALVRLNNPAGRKDKP